MKPPVFYVSSNIPVNQTENKALISEENNAKRQIIRYLT